MSLLEFGFGSQFAVALRAWNRDVVYRGESKDTLGCLLPRFRARGVAEQRSFELVKRVSHFECVGAGDYEVRNSRHFSVAGRLEFTNALKSEGHFALKKKLHVERSSNGSSQLSAHQMGSWTRVPIRRDLADRHSPRLRRRLLLASPCMVQRLRVMFRTASIGAHSLQRGHAHAGQLRPQVPVPCPRSLGLRSWSSLLCSCPAFSHSRPSVSCTGTPLPHRLSGSWGGFSGEGCVPPGEGRVSCASRIVFCVREGFDVTQ